MLKRLLLTFTCVHVAFVFYVIATLNTPPSELSRTIVISEKKFIRYTTIVARAPFACQLYDLERNVYYVHFERNNETLIANLETRCDQFILDSDWDIQFNPSSREVLSYEEVK